MLVGGGPLSSRSKKSGGFFWLFIWRLCATVICLLFSIIIGSLVVEITVGIDSEYGSPSIVVISGLLFLFSFASIQVFSALFKNVAMLSRPKQVAKYKDEKSTQTKSKKKDK